MKRTCPFTSTQLAKKIRVDPATIVLDFLVGDSQYWRTRYNKVVDTITGDYTFLRKVAADMSADEGKSLLEVVDDACRLIEFHWYLAENEE